MYKKIFNIAVKQKGGENGKIRLKPYKGINIYKFCEIEGKDGEET